MQIPYKKMAGAGNDFIIIDSRQNKIELSKSQIANFSSRENIGCDQFIVIRNSSSADCFMDIYNSNGSKSSACGNATRCVASIIMEEKSQEKITIETKAEILPCQKSGDKISVQLGKPIFGADFAFEEKNFFTVNVGNPHAVTFLDEIPQDQDFFRIGQAIESHPNFPEKTNVEFAKIIDNSTIEVRVFERGAGETQACGTGACAVGVAAIQNNLVNSKKITTKFKGGDLVIEWPEKNSPITMTGGFEMISEGFLEV